MSPGIKCFLNPMKVREINCQRILTSTKVAQEETLCYELFVGKIPSDCDEDELIPFFETIGPLHTFRLMMKHDHCNNRSHAYVTYIYESDAKQAVTMLNGKELRKGHPISVARSFNNCRIFIGGIPINRSKDEVWHELQNQGVPNIVDVIMYRSYSNRSMNRGFVFVEFPSHKFAAKMRLRLRGLKLWNREVVVDWSVPQPVVTEEEMSQVKTVYLRNLSVTYSREELRYTMEKYIDPPDIEKVYKFKDYAFIHLSSRELALDLIECLKDHYKGTYVEVSLAKPRNHYTKPGYRKYQLLKNDPYVPKYREESSKASESKMTSSTPVKNQESSHSLPTQNWIHSLPLSPVDTPLSPSPYHISPEDEIEQLLDEDQGNINFNYPLTYHFSNGVTNIKAHNEFDGFCTSAYDARMNNFEICCTMDYFWKSHEDHYKY